jgi:hypothetical protein
MPENPISGKMMKDGQIMARSLGENQHVRCEKFKNSTMAKD